MTETKSVSIVKNTILENGDDLFNKNIFISYECAARDVCLEGILNELKSNLVDGLNSTVDYVIISRKSTQKTKDNEKNASTLTRSSRASKMIEAVLKKSALTDNKDSNSLNEIFLSKIKEMGIPILLASDIWAWIKRFHLSLLHKILINSKVDKTKDKKMCVKYIQGPGLKVIDTTNVHRCLIVSKCETNARYWEEEILDENVCKENLEIPLVTKKTSRLTSTKVTTNSRRNCGISKTTGKNKLLKEKFCECCSVIYKDPITHLNSKIHQEYGGNEKNFTLIDNAISDISDFNNFVKDRFRKQKALLLKKSSSLKLIRQMSLNDFKEDQQETPNISLTSQSHQSQLKEVSPIQPSIISYPEECLQNIIFPDKFNCTITRVNSQIHDSRTIDYPFLLTAVSLKSGIIEYEECEKFIIDTKYCLADVKIMENLKLSQTTPEKVFKYHGLIKQYEYNYQFDDFVSPFINNSLYVNASVVKKKCKLRQWKRVTVSESTAKEIELIKQEELPITVFDFDSYEMPSTLSYNTSLRSSIFNNSNISMNSSYFLDDFELDIKETEYITDSEDKDTDYIIPLKQLAGYNDTEYDALYDKLDIENLYFKEQEDNVQMKSIENYIRAKLRQICSDKKNKKTNVVRGYKRKLDDSENSESYISKRAKTSYSDNYFYAGVHLVGAR